MGWVNGLGIEATKSLQRTLPMSSKTGEHADKVTENDPNVLGAAFKPSAMKGLRNFH